MRSLGSRLLRDVRGATALEFALVAPAFIALLVGVFYVSNMIFTAGSLRYAVQEAARCASVKTTVCSSPEATVNYARSRFYGPGGPGVFTAVSAACGNRVSGTVNYDFQLFTERKTIPIKASACFP